VPAFAGFGTVTTLIKGDGSLLPNPPAVTSTGNYDIHAVTLNLDGSVLNLLTVTYDTNYNACWRLFQASLAELEQYPNLTISQAVALEVDPNTHRKLLIQLDSGFGTPGYY
jgi:hypothetical protein